MTDTPMSLLTDAMTDVAFAAAMQESKETLARHNIAMLVALSGCEHLLARFIKGEFAKNGYETLGDEMADVYLAVLYAEGYTDETVARKVRDITDVRE